MTTVVILTTNSDLGLVLSLVKTQLTHNNTLLKILLLGLLFLNFYLHLSKISLVAPTPAFDKVDHAGRIPAHDCAIHSRRAA